MSQDSFNIFEPETGDEARVKKTDSGILLAIRTERGTWHTIELEAETAKSLAEGVEQIAAAASARRADDEQRLHR